MAAGKTLIAALLAAGGINFFDSLGCVIVSFRGGAIADARCYAATSAFAGATEIIIALVFLPMLLKLKLR